MNLKTYKIRKAAANYNYIVTVPENIVEHLGLNAIVSFVIGDDGGVKLELVSAGDEFKAPEKKKAGKKKRSCTPSSST